MIRQSGWPLPYLASLSCRFANISILSRFLPRLLRQPPQVGRLSRWTALRLLGEHLAAMPAPFSFQGRN